MADASVGASRPQWTVKMATRVSQVFARGVPVICQNRDFCLNPKITHLDHLEVDIFLRHVRARQAGNEVFHCESVERMCETKMKLPPQEAINT